MKMRQFALRDRSALASSKRTAARVVLAALTTSAGLSASANADVLHETFNTGIPSTWQVHDYLADEFSSSSSITWGTTSPETYGNYTGGDGLAAMADSDSAGDEIEYDIGLITPMMHLPTESGLTLSYLTNYQNMAGSDFADTDINTGSGWVTLLSWNQDHGDSFHNPIGELVTIPLDDYAGQNVQFRFHYYDPNQNDWNWYWQLDNVTVTPTPGTGAILMLAASTLARRRRTK
jgi:hypothetical protein